MRRGAGTRAAAAAFLVVLVALSIAFPLLSVAWISLSAPSPAEGLPSPWRVDGARLISSFLTAALIGVLATACAWPAAWAARALPARAFAVLLVPMLMPSYLAFIGWSQLRAPGTWLGDWLMRGPATGPNWWSIAAGRVCAVGGLVLWSWPLAMLVLAARIRRIDPSILDSLRMEPAPAWRRAITLAALCRGSLVGAALAVALVMLGSAVPLHVAQLDTYAIELWRLLAETPPAAHGRIWIASWPLVLIALLAGLWVGRRVVGAPESGDTAPPRTGRLSTGARWTLGGAGLLWALSVIAPGLLMAMDIRHPGFVADFWRAHAQGCLVTGAVAGVVAIVAAALSIAVWIGLDAWRGRVWREITRWCVVALIAAGLVPGVLVGSATAAAWNRLDISSPVIDLGAVVLAHVARFGFVAALVGWWAARCEPVEERALRVIDGADSLPGWFRTAWPAQSGLILAGAAAVGLLSFHEIEAAMMLQPAGFQSFPQQMLQLLHYNRMEDVATAVVVVLGCGLLASGLVVASASRPMRSPRRPREGGAATGT